MKLSLVLGLLGMGVKDVVVIPFLKSHFFSNYFFFSNKILMMTNRVPRTVMPVKEARDFWDDRTICICDDL